MENKHIPIKNEKKARYDRDSKNVIVHIKQSNPIVNNGITIGDNKADVIQTIGAEHMRRIHGQMVSERDNLQREIKKLEAEKELWDGPILGFDIKELEHAREKMKALAKLDEYEKNKTTLKNMVQRVNDVKKDVKDLLPIINQIPKK